MAQTVEKEPNELNFVYNRQPIVISTDVEALKVEGTNAEHKIVFSDTTAVADESFILDFEGKELTFIFKAVPDASTYQLPLYSVGVHVNLQGWITAIKTILAANYYIKKYWTLSSDATQLIFTSIDKGLYPCTCTEALSYLSFSTTTNGTENTYYSRREIMLQIFLVTTGGDVLLMEDIKSVNNANEASFCIEELFTPNFLLKFEFPDPGPGPNKIFKRENQCLAFKLSYALVLDSQVQNIEEMGSTYYILAGGIDNKESRFYKDYQTNFRDFADNNKMFLNGQPLQKYVGVKQTERLSFLIGSGLTALSLKGKVYYDDGTDHSFTVSTDNAPVAWNVYEFITGYHSLNVEQYNPAKTILKYEIWLEDQVDVISDIQTYLVDRTVYKNTKTFIFRNHKGAFDTLKCTGETIRDLQLETDTAAVVNEDGETQKLDQQITARENGEANTGWMDRISPDGKAVSYYLNDFLMSREVYEIRGTGRFRVRIFDPKPKYSSNDHTYALQFKHEDVETNTVYSGKLAGIEDLTALSDNYIFLTDNGKLLVD